MPPPDYSYVVQPVFKETKEITENLTKYLFNADEVRIGAVGFHGYDKETKKQKDEIYRLQAVLLNSKSVTEYNNEKKMNDLGRAIAKYVISQIANSDKYTKIQITLIIKEDNSQNYLKQNIFYKLPDYELTQMFDK